MPDIDGLKSTPVGTIQMWSGLITDIPRKWHLCDGTQGTPDMLSKFVKGSPDGVDGGATDGEDTVSLSVNELPPHGHSFSAGTHRHTIPVMPETPENIRTDIIRGSPTTPFIWSESTSGVTAGTKGSSTAHENKPPFFELAYIQKVE